MDLIPCQTAARGGGRPWCAVRAFSGKSLCSPARRRLAGAPAAGVLSWRSLSLSGFGVFAVPEHNTRAQAKRDSAAASKPMRSAPTQKSVHVHRAAWTGRGPPPGAAGSPRGACSFAGRRLRSIPVNSVKRSKPAPNPGLLRLCRRRRPNARQRRAAGREPHLTGERQSIARHAAERRPPAAGVRARPPLARRLDARRRRGAEAPAVANVVYRRGGDVHQQAVWRRGVRPAGFDAATRRRVREAPAFANDPKPKVLTCA